MGLLKVLHVMCEGLQHRALVDAKEIPVEL